MLGAIWSDNESGSGSGAVGRMSTSGRVGVAGVVVFVGRGIFNLALTIEILEK